MESTQTAAEQGRGKIISIGGYVARSSRSNSNKKLVAIVVLGESANQFVRF